MENGAESVDLNFLPLIYEILKSIEKDSYDVAQKVTDLQNKIQKAKEQVEKLPGIDLSKEEQERQVEVLRIQLNSKTDLLKKYKNLCTFDLT